MSSSSSSDPRDRAGGEARAIFDKLTKNHRVVEKTIASAWGNPQWTDLTIVCGERRWECHRLVVCSQSEFLRDACKDGSTEDLAALVDLSGDDPNDVERLLKSMYVGKTEYPPEISKRSLHHEKKASTETTSSETKTSEVTSAEEPSHKEPPPVLDANRPLPNGEAKDNTKLGPPYGASQLPLETQLKVPGVLQGYSAPYAPTVLRAGRHVMFIAMRTQFLAIKLGLPATTKADASQTFHTTLVYPYHVDFPLVLDDFYSRLAKMGEIRDNSDFMPTRKHLAEQVITATSCPDTSGPIEDFKKEIMEVVKKHRLILEDVIEAQHHKLAMLGSSLRDMNRRMSQLTLENMRSTSTQTSQPAVLTCHPNLRHFDTSKYQSSFSSSFVPSLAAAPPSPRAQMAQRRESDEPVKSGLTSRSGSGTSLPSLV